MAVNNEVLLEINHLSKHFTVEKNFFGKPTKVLKAVDDVSFKIYKQEAFGLVGESGCGKTTIGKMLANVYAPTSGEIIYNGVDLGKLSQKERRAYCKDIQLVFQDPYASLNPRMTIGDIIAEPIHINKLLPAHEIEKRVLYLLNCVGLASHQRNRYPHEFSGGQRQRVGIARALAVEPKLIVCDEPVSALDVSIQAQVLNLLVDLKEEFGLTYLFIAHGLNVVKHISDRVGVMYLGKLQELAEKHELYDHPLHPYTKALLSSTPVIDPKLKRNKERILLKGDVPSPINPPQGCRFSTRCYVGKLEACDKQCPEIIDVTGNKHYVACHKQVQ
ncbi:peptide ABC transporter ATP-binding protein [Sporanaerobium hydrogeniformans]|uniref:Peptide ABC transporter ATP-binding protein n=1 Tax=Sporanaerobium hydrogeniformans TaxID=3072179 RepID=A0AC61DCV9_9FIRM|nr:oligopeptide/dipeptide ABC transporter ATP-binding protein [Sporanaerobium hydrogeniformans]PHV70923.1 peptide ABC transporter ATP-binding protein [Sporanaerobium hydrogeniformans]